MIAVKELNKVVPNFLQPGNLVLIKGYPGSGKTTLAATLCEHISMSRGRCVYISFQEDREKFLSNTTKLGLRLGALEREGMFRYVHLPITLDIEGFMRFVQDDILQLMTPGSILVIDPINPAMRAVPGDAAKRAILQNFFASLPRLTNSTVVLISEEPRISEESLGDIDFVADIILSMKYRLERGLLTRILEIRKSRGAPTLVTEIPFSIRSITGLTLYPPVILSEIPPISKETLSFPCKLLKSYIGQVHKGLVIYVTYPPDMRPREIPYLIFGLTALNNARTLIISYRYPPDYIKTVFTRWLARDYGLPRPSVEELFDRHIIVESINPLSVSHTELMAKELELIQATNPDIVMFHGTDIFPLLGLSDKNYVTNLFNMLQMLAGMGVLVVRDSAYVDDSWYRLGAALARVVFRFETDENGNLRTYIWRGGAKAIIVNEDQLHSCVDEIVDQIAKKLRPVSPITDEGLRESLRTNGHANQ